MSDGARQMRRAIGWLGGGVFASAVLQFLLFFAAARYLGAAEYGAFSLALVVAMLAAPFCDLGTSVALVCTGAQRPAGLDDQLGASLLLRLVMAVPVGAVALAIGRLADYGPMFTWLFVPLFVATLADGAGTLAASACQARERMAAAAMLQIGRNLLRGGALVVVLLCGGGALALATTFAIASLAGVAPALHTALRGAPLRLRRELLGPTLRDALPFGATVLGTIVQAQIGTALLATFADDTEVGCFHAAARFVLLLQMIPQVVAMASAPLAYRTGVAGIAASAAIYRMKLSALAPLGLLATLFLATHSDRMVGMLLGRGFLPAGPLLMALAPIVFLKFANSCLGDTLSALARTSRLGIGCWLAVAVTVVAGLVLAPTHGALGIALASLLAEVVLFAFLTVQLAATGLDLAWRQVLPHTLLAAVAGGLTALFAPAWAAPVAAAVIALLALLRPTAEERQLLPRRAVGA